MTFRCPVATAFSCSVDAGKLPCTSSSWLPKAVYHGMPMPLAVNGRRAASSSPGIVGKPKVVFAMSAACPAGGASGCQ